MISVAGARFGTVDLAGLSAVGGSVAYASYGPEDAPAVMVLGGIPPIASFVAMKMAPRDGGPV